MNKTISHSLSLLTVFMITSCSVHEEARETSTLKTESLKIPITDYPSFKAQPDYPATSASYRNEEVFARTDASNSSIRISLSLQRAFLMNGEEVALDYPVSTGKTTHPTPTGTYTILEKIVDKRSNLYGKIYDASGDLVNGSADSRTSKVPPGGRFLGASMPYWMRLTWTGIGMHVGKVPRYPASHACIRGQSDVVPKVFSKVSKGTTVTIVR